MVKRKIRSDIWLITKSVVLSLFIVFFTVPVLYAGGNWGSVGGVGSIGGTTASVASITPSSANQGTTLTVTVEGSSTNFDSTSVLSFSGTGITVNGAPTIVSATELRQSITISSDATASIRNVNVTTSSVSEFAVGSGLFTVVSTGPFLASVLPTSAYQGDTLIVTLTGQNTHFTNGKSAANFGPNITVNSVTVTGTTQATANITIGTLATAGARSVTVTTTAEAATGTSIFTINDPSIQTFSPASATQGWSGDIAISGAGTHFISGNTVFSFGPGITVKSVNITGPISATANITVDASATTGARTITETTNLGTAGAETVTNSTGFSVTAAAGSDIVIDNYETTEAARIYYNAGATAAETPAYGITSAEKYEGNNSMAVTYTYPHGETGWGGLVGGILPSTLDISSKNGVILWVKGDGSNNTIRLDLKEPTNEAPANGEVYSSPTFTLNDTTWHEISIPLSSFTRNPYDGVTGGNGVFDKKIEQYQLVYVGQNTSSVQHFVDYIAATNINIPAAPTAPTNFAGSATGTTEITWSWTDTSTNESGFNIFDGTDSLKLTAGSNIVSTKESSLLPNSPYTRYVTSFNGNGTSGKSNAVTRFTLANAPVNLKQTGGTITSVKMAWNPGIGGASGYVIYRATDGGGRPVNPVKIATVNTATVTFEDGSSGVKLSPSTKYWYGISALNGDGVESNITGFDPKLSGPMTTLADDTPPTVTNVTFNGKAILAGDIIDNKPLINATLSDDVAVNPSTISVNIGGVTYTPSSLPPVVYDATTGIMTLTITDAIPQGDVTPTISVNDTSGNKGTYSIRAKVAGSGLSIDGDVFNIPNPFNPLSEKTKIGFNLSRDGAVTIYMFDSAARIILKRAVIGTAGYNEFEWNGMNDYGEIAGNGIYLVRITDGYKLLGKCKIWVIKR